MDDPPVLVEHSEDALVDGPPNKSQHSPDGAPPHGASPVRAEPPGVKTPEREAEDSTPPCPVRLIPDPHSTGFCVVVDGVLGANPDGTPLSMAQYSALAALVDVYPDPLTNPQLQEDS